MLFTVNRSPFESPNLESCLKTASEETPILLYENAVYAAQSGTAFEVKMTEVLKSHKIYALSADLAARAITSVIPGVTLIDYEGFVELVEQHTVCPWL